MMVNKIISRRKERKKQQIIVIVLLTLSLKEINKRNSFLYFITATVPRG